MNALLFLLILAGSLLTAPSAFGAGLPTAKPEDVGMDGARLARIGEILRAVFRLASMTKPLASVAATQLYERRPAARL